MTRVLALFGPTAVGKSTLAHLAAKALDGEIVVADPFQRYRGLEIAADSPTARERAEVPYHCVADLALTEASSAGAYARAAHEAIDDIIRRGHRPIVAGGTGLYLRAALCDLDFPPDVDAAVRRDVESLVRSGLEAAVEELRRRDPDAADRIDLRNPRRVARALELARCGIRRASTDRLWTDATRLPVTLVGVVRPRPVLDALIATRIRRELADGLVEELARALDTPGLSRAAAQIIGMREIASMRRGETDPSELPALLDARTRQLARAQLTWLRKTPGITTLDLGDDPPEDALTRVLDLAGVD